MLAALLALVASPILTYGKVGGEAEAAVNLADLRLEDLFAIGELAGGAGEIMVIDGQAWTSRMQGKTLQVEKNAAVQAALLVGAQVGWWREIRVSRPLTEPILDDYLEGLFGAGRGIYRVLGTAENVRYHVATGVGQRAAHRAIVQGRQITFVGFYSGRADDAGRLVPRGERKRVHVRSADGRDSGHVDGFRLAAGARLLVPRPAPTRRRHG